MTLPFHAALARAHAPVIAEIKPDSPKVGALLARRSVAGVAEDYRRAGAACLSATTGSWHGGHLSMIGAMADTGLPVLRKDFIISRRHLRDTLDAGGAAVLLTCALLRRADIERLALDALDIGLTPFVEAASSADLAGLVLPEGTVLAINNRDIRSRETDDGDIETGCALYARARRGHAGLLVSASGLIRPADVARARRIGFDGVLVGTALLSDPAGAFAATFRFVQAAARRQVESA